MLSNGGPTLLRIWFLHPQPLFLIRSHSSQNFPWTRTKQKNIPLPTFPWQAMSMFIPSRSPDFCEQTMDHLKVSSLVVPKVNGSHAFQKYRPCWNSGTWNSPFSAHLSAQSLRFVIDFKIEMSCLNKTNVISETHSGDFNIFPYGSMATVWEGTVITLQTIVNDTPVPLPFRRYLVDP